MTDTCGALRDVAILPFPYQGCVAPDSTPIIRISTEVVFAHICILWVSLLWPLQAFFSRNWFWLASHVVSTSFTILSHILTSWQNICLDAIDSRELPVHRAYIHTIHKIPKDVCVCRKQVVFLMLLWPPRYVSQYTFHCLLKTFGPNFGIDLCWDLFQIPHIFPPRWVSQNWSKALQILRTLLKRHQRQCTFLI